MFPGSSDIDQLEVIFNTVGVPNEENWPTFKDLPALRGGLEIANGNQENRLRERMARFDPLAIDLIDNLLRLNPKARYSAEDALEHIYFFKDPEPAIPGSGEYVVSFISERLISVVSKSIKHRMSMIHGKPSKKRLSS